MVSFCNNNNVDNDDNNDRLSGMLTVWQTLQRLSHLFLKNRNKQSNEVAAIMLRKLMLNKHEYLVQDHTTKK